MLTIDKYNDEDAYLRRVSQLVSNLLQLNTDHLSRSEQLAPSPSVPSNSRSSSFNPKIESQATYEAPLPTQLPSPY